MVKLHSLASSSSGNCYIYEFDETKILLDVGITKTNLFKKLELLNFKYEDINEILITHEHVDHIKGLKVLNKHSNKTINITEGTHKSLNFDLSNINYIKKNINKKINNVLVLPILVSHDASEPVGFIFEYDFKKYVHLLDTGYIPKDILGIIKKADFYLIESNYEEEALLTNPKYPFEVKKRISSDVGHLSNKQCNYYLKKLIDKNTKIVCFGHLSTKNNTKDLVDIINNEISDIDKYVLDHEKLMSIELCK